MPAGSVERLLLDLGMGGKQKEEKTMKFELKDYSGKVHKVDIPDGTKEVAGVIVSGDEILVYPVYSDPMCIHRLNDFLDGPFYRVLDESGAWIEKEDKQ